jgi:uncharacterized membrane protein YgdD (TMEM256/DUF423 family)
MKNPALALGAAFGLIGVGLGAFGAHGLEEVLKANDRLDTWDTAVLYQFVHSGLLLILGILALIRPASKLLSAATWTSTIGILIFSGSLYALSLTNHKWLGAITPIGGLSFLVAWTLLFIYALKHPKNS